MSKIYYLNDFNEELSDENWVLTLDISTLWLKYENKKIEYNEYINKLNDFIISKKDKLVSISTECFNEFSKNVKNDFKDIKDFYIYIDNIYDWADKYSINIKCEDLKKENSKNEVSN